MNLDERLGQQKKTIEVTSYLGHRDRYNDVIYVHIRRDNCSNTRQTLVDKRSIKIIGPDRGTRVVS